VSPVAPRPQRRKRSQYHHGDLRRALIDEAVRTIQREGVEALTLRTAGKHLGVSRTALYRHFADKAALLAAVATEGFRTLHSELISSWKQAGQGRDGFHAMGIAYVRFAVANPSHYRVMFGGFVKASECDPELMTEASAAFQVLVNSLVEQQKAGLVRHDDPEQLARFVWATVHGVAMLAIDGQLGQEHGTADALIRFAIERLGTGIGL
jgi:AcrR family transcriptional regulator